MTGEQEGAGPAPTLFSEARNVDVVVVGAGQAVLSTAYTLARRGLAPWTGFVVLDANDGPGGAWRHRWPSLTVG